MQLFSADATTVQNKRGIVPKTHKKLPMCFVQLRQFYSVKFSQL